MGLDGRAHRRNAFYLDAAAERYEAIYVSAGQRGLDVRLSPSDLVKVTE